MFFWWILEFLQGNNSVLHNFCFSKKPFFPFLRHKKKKLIILGFLNMLFRSSIGTRLRFQFLKPSFLYLGRYLPFIVSGIFLSIKIGRYILAIKKQPHILRVEDHISHFLYGQSDLTSKKIYNPNAKLLKKSNKNRNFGSVLA